MVQKYIKNDWTRFVINLQDELDNIIGYSYKRIPKKRTE